MKGMRFASIGGQSNYAQAGKAVADDAARIFDTTRKHSVNFGELAQTQRDVQSRENAAISAADSKVAQTKVKSDATVKINKEEIYRDELRAKSRRKAGVVAALGKTGAGLADVFTGKSAKRDHSSSIALQDKLTKSADELRAGIKPIDLNGNSSASTTGGSNAGGTNTGGTATSSSSTTGAGGKPISSFQASGKSGKYSVADMTQLAIGAGFTPEQAKVMGAIGFAESGGRAGIDTVQSGLDPSKSNEFSVGLFQVNAQAHGDKLTKLGYTEDDLRDPQKAAQVAKMVYDEVGSFKPWSVYKSGAYQQYLQ